VFFFMVLLCSLVAMLIVHQDAFYIALHLAANFGTKPVDLS